MWLSIEEAGLGTPLRAFSPGPPPPTLPASKMLTPSFSGSLALLVLSPTSGCLSAAVLCEALLLGTSRLQQNEAAPTQGGGGGMRKDRSGLR